MDLLDGAETAVQAGRSSDEQSSEDESETKRSDKRATDCR